LRKVEGVVPGRFAVVVLEVSVQDWAYLFRGGSCEDRTVPGAVTVYTAIDQPDIDFSLIGVYTECITTGELARCATMRTMAEHTRCCHRQNPPADFSRAGLLRGMHSNLPFREALRNGT